VIREALRLFIRFDEARSREIDLLNQRITDGLAQLDRSEGVPGDEARRITSKRIASRRESRRQSTNGPEAAGGGDAS
jgi:DNA helicase HerA-like ATPase